jgi:hypothetical protein
MLPKGILKRPFGSVLLCDLELFRRKAIYRFRTFRVIRHVCTRPDLLKFYNRIARTVDSSIDDMLPGNWLI